MRKLLRFICEPIFRERMQIKYILNHDRSGFLNYIMTEHLRGKYNLILSKDAEIEEDVWFPHPHNIIVGGVVKIGKKCVLYHDVTLGQNRGEYPIVGNGVIIYAGAKVIGNNWSKCCCHKKCACKCNSCRNSCKSYRNERSI